MTCPGCGHSLDLHDEDEDRCSRGCGPCVGGTAVRRSEAGDLAAVTELRRTVRRLIAEIQVSAS